MNSSLPKLSLDLKSRSPALEIIDLDADNKDDGIHLSENCNEKEEEDAERVMMATKDRNNNSNSNIGAAVGDQVKGLARCF